MCLTSKEIKKKLLQQSYCKRRKKFWKTVKTLFSYKTESAVSTTSTENRKIAENQNNIANILADYFPNAASTFRIPKSSNINPRCERISCPTLKFIMRYRRHPNIRETEDAYQGSSFFYTYLEIHNLSRKKAICNDDIPFNIPKENINSFSECICDFYSNVIMSSKFPSLLNKSNITSVFKKYKRKELKKKQKSRSISVLQVLFKIFEKLISKQLSIFLETILSKFQFGLRMGYRVQYCLSLVLVKWKLTMENNEVFGALLNDLSKTFDCKT